MTAQQGRAEPEHTAVRVALWRALHVQIDPSPHVFVDEMGAELVGEEGWRKRPDMEPEFSKSMRASIVGRAKLIEDLVEDCAKAGVTQYVILGAGLDSFAQRRPELGSSLKVFEVDQPGPQSWKQKRLAELGLDTPDWLKFVPVDFESGQDWCAQLRRSGFDTEKPSIIVSTGVSMYLSRETNRTTFEQVVKFASGTLFATTFMLSLDLLEPKERAIMEFVMKKAAESNTPFLSLYSPTEIQAVARGAGFRKTDYISGEDIYERYFAGRTDGLRAGSAEAFLVATV